MNRIEQARKATKVLNGLLWRKYISVNKKRVLYMLIESVLSCGWKIWTPHYKLQKKLLRLKMDVWRKAARTTRLLKEGNEAIRGKKCR
jgi:hypothetical protein